MKTADKLRFLADRVEDGKEFIFNNIEHCFRDGFLHYKDRRGWWLDSKISFRNIISGDGTFKLKPRWEFTEEEKAILRNLPSNYRFIARDRDETLFIYDKKPFKGNGEFCVKRKCEIKPLSLYEHLFKSVQWSDEEPCEFREYL